MVLNIDLKYFMKYTGRNERSQRLYNYWNPLVYHWINLILVTSFPLNSTNVQFGVLFGLAEQTGIEPIHPAIAGTSVRLFRMAPPGEWRAAFQG